MLSVETDERRVTTVTLRRPEVRNAFNGELIQALMDTFEDLDDDTRVVVIAGEDPVFCAGADLTWMRSTAGLSRSENVRDSAKLRRMLEAIDGCAVPVVGRIQGACMAGGTGLAACCDVAVAAEGTRFAWTETRLGLVPAVISPYLVRKVGYSFARAFFLSAEVFDAQRALQVGLVHYVVPHEQLDSKVESVVNSLLACGPLALLETRNLLEDVSHRPVEDLGQRTIDCIADARVSAEGQEGVAAFFAKRPPHWAASDQGSS